MIKEYIKDESPELMNSINIMIKDLINSRKVNLLIKEMTNNVRINFYL